MNDANRRDLAFACADTGAVIGLTWTAGPRPVLERAAVFPATGDVLPLDAGVLSVRDGGGAGTHLSLAGRAGAAVPVGVELDLEPLVRGPVSLSRGTGTLAVGSVLHRLTGSAWSEAGGRGGFRARAVFQDGSAVHAAGGVATLARGAGVRTAEVRGLREEARAVSWDGMTAAIRDAAQRTAAGSPGLEWAPFVFVWSGVTGLGLVEWRPGAAPLPAGGLPDPF